MSNSEKKHKLPSSIETLINQNLNNPWDQGFCALKVHKKSIYTSDPSSPVSLSINGPSGYIVYVYNDGEDFKGTIYRKDPKKDSLNMQRSSWPRFRELSFPPPNSPFPLDWFLEKRNRRYFIHPEGSWCVQSSFNRKNFLYRFDESLKKPLPILDMGKIERGMVRDGFQFHNSLPWIAIETSIHKWNIYNLHNIQTRYNRQDNKQCLKLNQVMPELKNVNLYLEKEYPKIHPQYPFFLVLEKVKYTHQSDECDMSMKLYYPNKDLAMCKKTLRFHGPRSAIKNYFHPTEPLFFMQSFGNQAPHAYGLSKENTWNPIAGIFKKVNETPYAGEWRRGIKNSDVKKFVDYYLYFHPTRSPFIMQLAKDGYCFVSLYKKGGGDQWIEIPITSKKMFSLYSGSYSDSSKATFHKELPHAAIIIHKELFAIHWGSNQNNGDVTTNIQKLPDFLPNKDDIPCIFHPEHPCLAILDQSNKAVKAIYKYQGKQWEKVSIESNMLSKIDPQRPFHSYWAACMQLNPKEDLFINERIPMDI